MRVLLNSLKVVLFLALAGLAGCKQNAPDRMHLSFGTYSTTPVMLLEFTVNESNTPVGLPGVLQGNSDLVASRMSSGSYSSDWPGDTSVTRIEATWVELLTHRAYSAQLAVDTAQLPRRPSLTNMADIKPIFGPHGLMILAGEASGANPEPVDISQVCGTRQSALDKDFTLVPLAHAGLTEALQVDYPPITSQTICPEPDA